MLMLYAKDWHASVLIIGPNRTTVLIHDETKPAPRLWKFPGGKKEPFEDNPFLSVIRETKEETGLVLDPKRIIFVGGQERERHTKYFFIATIDSFDGLVKKSKEREITAIFTIKELDKMVDLHPTYHQFYLEAKRAGLV